MTGCKVKYSDPLIFHPFCFCDLDQNHCLYTRPTATYL